MPEPPHENQPPHPEPLPENQPHPRHWRKHFWARAWAVWLVLFQVYLWTGFLVQTVRAPAPTFDVVSYSTAIASGIATVIWCIVTRRSLWLASAWLVYTISQLTVNFSYLYWSHGSASNFTTPLTHLDAIYVTVGTLSTAGTGNIAPISQTARGFQTLQNVLDLGLVLLAVSLFVSRFPLAFGAESVEPTPQPAQSGQRGQTGA